MKRRRDLVPFEDLRVTNLALFSAIHSLSTGPEAARALWELIFVEGVRFERSERDRDRDEFNARLARGEPGPLTRDAQLTALVVVAHRDGTAGKA